MRPSRGRRASNRRMNMGRAGPNVVSAAATASSGTLITDHLGLHELDLELSLLKRKREIIEQQQIFSGDCFDRPSDYDFNQPHQSFNPQQNDEYQSVPTWDFTQYYNDPPWNQQHGTKRQAGNDGWQSNMAPKRFGGAQNRSRNKPRQFISPWEQISESHVSSVQPGPRGSNTQQHPPFAKPLPLMAKPWLNSKPASIRRNFNPTKVTKPKPNSAPNKLNTHSTTIRKNLVNEASNLVQQPKDEVLQAHVPASKQLMGRLELALGSIFKQVRIEGSDNDCSLHAVRSIKQEIRDRIRNIMTGQVVGPASEIVALYRKKFPLETDKDLIILAKEIELKKAKMAKYAEHPEKYFKSNFNKLLATKLEDMFEKLRQLYDGKVDKGKTLPEIMDSIWEEEEKLMEAKSAAVNPDDSQNNDLNDTNGKPTPTEEMGPVQEKEVTEDAKIDKTLNGSEIERGYASEPHEVAFYNRSVDKLLTQRLPQLLPKFKSHIMSILDVDEEYRKTKAAIIMKADALAESYPKDGNEQNTQNKEQSQGDASVAVQKNFVQRTLPYYVKVFGRPALPKKKQMQTFLDQFHPNSIKKHRGIHNLLFIGFKEKSDYDNILAANLTVIGNCSLDVKISEIKRSPLQNSSLNNSDVIMVEPESTPLSSFNEDEEEVVKGDIAADDTTEQSNTESTKQVNEKTENDEKTQNDEKIEGVNKNDTGKLDESDDVIEVFDQDINEIVDLDPEVDQENVDEPVNDNETKDALKKVDIEAVKNDAQGPVKGTATRASTRIAEATPGAIKTRNASKLVQNN